VLHALIVFAQEAAHEEETSKTAYYVAGSALAAFAVIISFIGIRGHERFPGSKGGRNIAVLVCAVLVGATMATAVLTG
jgi:hypothetical protein